MYYTLLIYTLDPPLLDLSDFLGTARLPLQGQLRVCMSIWCSIQNNSNVFNSNPDCLHCLGSILVSLHLSINTVGILDLSHIIALRQAKIPHWCHCFLRYGFVATSEDNSEVLKLLSCNHLQFKLVHYHICHNVIPEKICRTPQSLTMVDFCLGYWPWQVDS
jgi:hypothetical protein